MTDAPWWWTIEALLVVMAWLGGIGLTWMLYEVKGWTNWLLVIVWPAVFALAAVLKVVVWLLEFLVWIKNKANAA